MRIKNFLAAVDTTFSDLQNGIVNDRGSELVFKIQELSFYCRRLSTAQIGVLIALAALELENDEAYLNIGVWDGFSLLAASIGAPDAITIGVDNFSEMHEQKQPLLNPELTRDYGDTRGNFYRALKHCASSKTTFHETDWRIYMRDAHFPSGGVGLAYYDGDHTKEAHDEFFKKIPTYLSSECLIFIDDIRIDFVRESVESFLSAHPDFQLLLEIGGKRRRDPAWWGGFMVLGRFNKSSNK